MSSRTTPIMGQSGGGANSFTVQVVKPVDTSRSVLLEGWAAHDGPQLAKWPRGHLPGLGLPLVTAALLAGRLVEPRPNIALPVLVEVAVGDDIVPLGSHG